MTIDQSLYEVLSDFATGEVSLPELCDDFRMRNWGAPAMSEDELMGNEDHPTPENDWALVEAHRRVGNITPEEYDALVDVVHSEDDDDADVEENQD